MEQLLWWLCHGLLSVSLAALRPGWLLGVALTMGLLGHAWRRRPRQAPAFELGGEGLFWLPPSSQRMYRLRQAELGPWHVYLVLERAGSIARLRIYKDTLNAPAWAALRRRLLLRNKIG